MFRSANLLSMTLVSVFLLFSSCEEVIEIDLNDSDPQIVVEGKISAGNLAEIKLTLSVNFDEDNYFPPVEKATVMISDNLGNREVLYEISPGVYKTLTIRGVEGRTYALSITSANNLLSSEGTVPFRVEFDSLQITKLPPGSVINQGPGENESDDQYAVAVFFRDPPLTNNYYRFIEFVNGIQKREFTYSDRLRNGTTSGLLIYRFGRSLKTGDRVVVEMQCITKEVYDYYNSLENFSGGPGSATPANPYSNLTGTDLGYFSAFTTERKQIMVK